ncbi:MAG: InlB B-repeat-containing protein, partial [Anaeroplasmataceae bacterium]|nr:InlB B-repeat-containing protein [Anaeroplasmataceae bacterium]
AEVNEGYEWVKWESLDAQICPDGNFEDYTFNMPASDISFYALAIKLDEPTPETFMISFKLNEDALISSQAVTEGGQVIKPKNPIKEGHTFKGWSTNKDEYVEFDFQTVITSNFNLYAFFEINTYVVQFMDGEDIVSSATAVYDSFVDRPEVTPSKMGYTFKGWSISKDEYLEYDFQTLIINNINLYAFYEPNTYVVQFVDGEDVISTVSVLYNDIVSKPESNPSKTGYTFKGWSNSKNEYIEFDFTSNIKENIHLYAFYEANKLTVTFLNGQTIFALKEVNYNTNVTAPDYEPTQTGYNFIGWYTESEEKFDFNKEIITENIILYAKWTKKESPAHGGYMIIFDSNDGSYVSSQVIMQGSKVMKPTNPTKAGYTFEGWYKDSSLDTIWNFNKDIVTEPMILYAKWIETIEPTIEQFTITFNSNEGSAIASQIIMKGDKVTKPENPLKEGYIFEGWYQDSDLNTPWDFEEGLVTDSMTLYASWTKESEEPSLEDPVTEQPTKKTSWIIIIFI